MLTFFVQKKKALKKSFQSDSHDKPSVFPSFVLVQNDGWNDYSSFTWFSLFYYDNDKNQHLIGDLKLMHEEEADTYNVIKDGFSEPLDEHFCSLGLDTRYYYNIVKKIANPETIKQLLYYLRDCTQDGRIYERFNNTDRFKNSLFRDMASQEAYRAAGYIIHDDDPDTAFSFTYNYHAIYNPDQCCKWEVSFQQQKPSYLRTVGVIGENGVGKTMLLTSLVKDILQETTPESLNKKPRFQTCVAICSSERDRLLQVKSHSDVYYYSCCLKQKDCETFDLMRSAIEDNIMTRPMLYRRSITKRYYETLQEHLSDEIIKDLFIFNTDENDDEKEILNITHLEHLINILSSGQLQVFELITYIYAHIHLSSLLVFDEPEVHMHPSFIMNFMPLLNRLLKEFKSFAIISTHTPLLIRELVQQNVYRMALDPERNPSVERVAFRTFGEDISVLYHNIFEYNESKSYFRQVIRQMINEIQNSDFDDDIRTRDDYIKDITKQLSEDMELGLSGRSAIRDIVYEMID